MSLSDLELCKKIAEIEGHKVDPEDRFPRFMVFKGKSNKLVGYVEYNPLTNKALLFDLMVWHRVRFDSDALHCTILKPLKAFERSFYSEDQIPRAILECIVEANS